MISCNPNTLYLVGSGTIHFEIFAKQASGKTSESWYYFTQTPEMLTFSLKQGLQPNQAPTARIDIDGKEKVYYSWENGVLICKTETCSLNLTGENSSDPDGEKLSFLWLWGENSVSTSRDP
jgi:hypothetical protein